jgi:hypothetical protein
MELPAAQEMEVEVGHGLAGRLLAIDDEPVTVGYAKIFRQLPSHQVQMAEEIAILFTDVRVGSYHLAGNDEHMHRRLRIDIPKRDAPVILVNNSRRDFPLDNLQEYIVLHHGRFHWKIGSAHVGPE